jgi:predicted RNA-binding Zn ribbon-like protein
MPSPMKFVGERPCLDFVNTVGGWTDRVIADKLKNYEDLARWAELAGLMPAEHAHPLVENARRHPEEANQVLKRSIALRRVIRGVFRAVLEKRKPRLAHTRILLRELTVARSNQRLKYNGSGFGWTWNASYGALDSILWRICVSTAELLTSPDLSRVRECGGENCGWMFLDNSRNHSRHWCDMQDCGNRAKVRRFRQRQRGG